MRKVYSSVGAAAGFGLICAGMIFGGDLMSTFRPALASAQGATDMQLAPEPAWAAVAPGRVQPKGGEIRISAVNPALVREVLVQVSDKVKSGDLLIAFDDDGSVARLMAARAGLAVRTAERDAIQVTGAALDRRKAEDEVFAAEQRVFDAQIEADRLLIAMRNGTAAVGEVEKARSALIESKDKLVSQRDQLHQVLKAAQIPPYSKEDAGLLSARSEVLILENAIEKTKVRAPRAAMVLDVSVKPGEISIAGDNSLILLGDTSKLQVRAELEERDLEKVFPGQRVVLKTDTFQGRSFDGRVLAVAKALTAPLLSSRNKRGPTDVDVLEVTIDIESSGPLIPGMRVDAFFQAMDQAPKSSSN